MGKVCGLASRNWGQSLQSEPAFSILSKLHLSEPSQCPPDKLAHHPHLAAMSSSTPLKQGRSCRVFTLRTQQRPCGGHLPLRRAQDLHHSGKSGGPKAGFDIPLSYPQCLSPSLGSLRVSEPRAELLGAGERVAGTLPWVLVPDGLSISRHSTFICESHDSTASPLCHSSRE